MEPGKKYSTVVENTFHLSMAALDLESVKKGMYQKGLWYPYRTFHFIYLK